MSDISPEESERRAKIAQEKLWGSLIEKIERDRMQPIAKSIMLRGILLSQSVVVSGWNVEHSSTHVHCPRCGKIVARYFK